jgi:hypothetical protein
MRIRRKFFVIASLINTQKICHAMIAIAIASRIEATRMKL